MSTIGIIIPVYNESGNIERNLDAIAAGIKGSDDQFSANIIYDFPEDTTLPVIERIRSKYTFPINLIKNTVRGVCQAIKTGLDQAQGEFLVVTMADMSDDYAILPRMVEVAKQGYDVVCGSRYMKGGKTHGGPFIKQNLSRLAGLSLYALTRIPTHDITNSYKLYRKSFLKTITIESTGGFELGMEITAKAFLKGYKIAEIPSQWWDRTEGKSRFQLLRWLPKYLRWYGLLLSRRK
jgi:glycosyltransferase involved in cell wall biosynthesis